jgi:hypothetical protein
VTTLPLDFNTVRKTLVDEVQRVTGLTCILDEPEGPEVSPRPCKPYMSFKITSPAVKSGDDSNQNVPDESGHPTNIWNRGGQRKMVIDFNSYGTSHEEAYNYMGLWQIALEQETTQEVLRRAGIAVWLNGSIRDLSQLLSTAYEGRANMSVEFGITFNLTEELTDIHEVNVTGETVTDQGNSDTITMQVIAP